ncbi:hypothetical protein FRC08_010729 [Ceratobasidium sp. 394]|nr:hypothetical protein FRC08_010729 [Ceratobasidium sp. 394]
MSPSLHSDLPPMTLRGQRACRPLYSYLRNPIYITCPDALAPLLENAPFDVLPKAYQARTLEEARGVRRTPFAGNDRGDERRKRRCSSGLSYLGAEDFGPQMTGWSPKFIECPTSSPDVFVRTIRKRQRSASPISTSSSLASPPVSSPCDYMRRREGRVKFPRLSVPFRRRAPSINGVQMVAGVGLFNTCTRRISVFQRNNSFVWVIRPARLL